MWLLNHRYSAGYDAALLALMDKHKFHSLTEYTVMLGDCKLWISGHPFASFSLMAGSGRIGIRPSRKTILLAYERMMFDCLHPTNSND